MRKFTVVWNIWFLLIWRLQSQHYKRSTTFIKLLDVNILGKRVVCSFLFFFSCFIIAAKPNIAYPWSFAAFCWKILYIFSGKQLGYLISAMSYTTFAFKELNIQLNKLKSKGTKNKNRDKLQTLQEYPTLRTSLGY